MTDSDERFDEVAKTIATNPLLERFSAYHREEISSIIATYLECYPLGMPHWTTPKDELIEWSEQQRSACDTLGFLVEESAEVFVLGKPESRIAALFEDEPWECDMPFTEQEIADFDHLYGAGEGLAFARAQERLFDVLMTIIEQGVRDALFSTPRPS